MGQRPEVNRPATLPAMPRSAVRLLCLLALLACTPLAHPQTAQQVHRCIGAHGEPVFSGQPCGTPAPSSGGTAAAGNSGWGSACAASPQALRQAIAAAFTTQDVNKLAGLILWRGMDQASARVTLHALAIWLKQPLAGIAYAYATGPRATEVNPASIAGDPSSGSSVATQPPTGLEISTGGGTRDFGVTESGGCWWLTF